jgi:hypothetical protein
MPLGSVNLGLLTLEGVGMPSDAELILFVE